MGTSVDFKKVATDFQLGADVLKYCYQCSKCSDNCPITKVTTNSYKTSGYNPRQNILMTLLGHEELLLNKEELTIWGCTVCVTCDEVCPQGIELTEIFALLKNQSIALGKGPDPIYNQAKAVYESGKAIPPQPAIERRRTQLGLPPVAAPDISEIQKLLKNIGSDKKLK
ncbi:MAG: 4Fe-4S dicluster domain-containing protein [Candidatus Hodarchaeota archaeon]